MNRPVTETPIVANSTSVRLEADAAAIDLAALVRFAFLLCGDRDLAQDVVAEAVARSLARRGGGDVENLGAYLRRTVVNELRGRWRREGVAARFRQVRSGVGRGDRSGEETVVERDRVLRLLRDLPIRQRTAIVLRYYEDRSVAEIASAMRTSEGTVKAQLSRGLRRLQDSIRSEET